MTDSSANKVKLLVLDIEGTLFRTTVRLPGTCIDSTIWQALAQALGSGAVAAEVATHERWRRGGYRSYLDWMKVHNYAATTIENRRRYLRYFRFFATSKGRDEAASRAPSQACC